MSEDFERKPPPEHEKNIEDRGEIQNEQAVEQHAYVSFPFLTPEQQKEEIARINDRISEELQELNKVRAELGLEPTDKSRALEHLRKERESASTPEISRLRLERIHKSVSDVGAKARYLASSFHKREEARLYPLLQPNDIVRIGAAGSRLQELMPSLGESGYEELTRAIHEIGLGFNNFGKYPARSTREDLESLREIVFRVQQTKDSLRVLEKTFSEEHMKAAEEVLDGVRRTAQILDTVQMETKKRASRVSAYLRGY